MRLKALRQRAGEIQAAIDALGAALEARGATATFTDEERARLRELQQAKADNAAMLVEAEAANEADRNYRGATVDADANAAADAARSIQVGADRRALDPRRGFANLADFAMTVRAAVGPGRNAQAAQRLRGLDVVAVSDMPTASAAPSNYMQEAGGVVGEGYEVPAEFRQTIFQLAFPANDLFDRIDAEPTQSNAVDIEADETTPWGSTGVQAYWRGQGAQLTASKLKTNLRTVRLNELYAFVLAEQELLADAPRLNDRLTVKSALAIRWKVSDAIMRGTGAGMPQGWLNSGALVTVAKESGQLTGTIVIANILKMYSRILADGGQPFWVANRDVIPQLAAIQIGNYPVFIPPTMGIAEAPNGTLLGLPIVYSEHASTLSTVGDIQLINPAGYYAAIKAGGANGVQFDTSIHLYFDYAIQAFRWILRIGGQPFLSAPVSPANGSNTKSHFVVLATR